MGRAYLLLTIAVLALALACGSCDSHGDSGAPTPRGLTTCPGTYAPCGGDPTGTWRVESLCVESNPADALDILSSNSPSCADTVKSASLIIAGTLTYNAGTVTYDLTKTWSGSLSYSSACVLDVLQGDPANCAGYKGYFTNTDFGCGMSGTSCVCSYSGSTSEKSSRSYMLRDSTVMDYDTPISNIRTYELCVDGTSMSLHGPLEVSSVSGVLQLKKQ